MAKRRYARAIVKWHHYSISWRKGDAQVDRLVLHALRDYGVVADAPEQGDDMHHKVLTTRRELSVLRNMINAEVPQHAPRSPSARAWSQPSVDVVITERK